jgi:hypothetical protein
MEGRKDEAGKRESCSPSGEREIISSWEWKNVWAML